MIKFDKNNKIKYSYDLGIEEFKPIIPKSEDDWVNNSDYKKIKEKIKEHYSIIQDNKCAYCREDINFNGYGEPIEHIIPKSKKYKFMFHPKNLCLSCYGCNTKKGTKNPLIRDFSDYGDEYNDFPNESSHYKIIHPHFDSFSYYIEENEIFYKPRKKRKKGEETILMCDLNRFDLLYKRIRRKKNIKSIISYLTNIIRNSNDETEIKNAEQFFNAIIKRYNYIKKLKK